MSTFSSSFCLFWYRQQYSDRICSIDAPASNDDGRASSGGPVKWHCVMFIGSFRQIEREERPKRTTRLLYRPPFDVSWCRVTGFFRLLSRTGGISGSKWAYKMVQGGCESATALFCVLNLKTMAGCRWKKRFLWMRSREENAPSSLDISLFLSRGRGEARRNFPKQRLAWQKGHWLEVRSRRKESFALRVSCSMDEIHHHKDPRTYLTRPGSLPSEELRSYPSSKRLEEVKFVLPRKSGKIS